jgi:hypothetical protein
MLTCKMSTIDLSSAEAYIIPYMKFLESERARSDGKSEFQFSHHTARACARSLLFRKLHVSTW